MWLQQHPAGGVQQLYLGATDRQTGSPERVEACAVSGLKPSAQILAGPIHTGALDKVQLLWPLVRDQGSHWGYLGSYAGSIGSVAVAQFLVAQGVNFNAQAMGAAAHQGDLSMVQ